VLRRVRELRITPMYVVLVVTGWAALCLWGSVPIRTAVVAANSTNVDNLLQGRFSPLLTSALVLEGRECLLAVPFVAVLVGIGELVWGRVRVVVTFLLGHVGASLVVFAGLAAGLAAHLVCPRVATDPDVGVSYGTVAVLGALLVTAPVPHAARLQVLAVLLAATVALIGGTFTDVGHLASLVLGLAVGRIRPHEVLLPVAVAAPGARGG
jgi:hypothetical protein